MTSIETAPAITPSPEVQSLLAALASQRRHILGALDGLTDDQLRRPVLPSGWTCLGLVNHLALDVERFWFRCVLTGDPEAITDLDHTDNAWQLPPDVPTATVLARYRAETHHADETAAATPPDAPLAWWPRDLFGEPHLHTHRDLLLHVLTETACHAGHLDAARELLDGRSWLVLT